MDTDKITELMKLKRITVYKLAKTINYDRTNLKKILSGKIKDPTISTAKAIAKALDVTVDEILTKNQEDY